MGSSAAAYEGLGTSNPYLTVICAFAGAIASTLIILALSRFRDMTPEHRARGRRVIRTLHGATALIQYFATDTQVAAVVFWTFGDLGRTSYREIAIMTIVTLAAFAFFHLNRWSFNAMESGEGTAHGLGLNVKRTRLLNMIVGAFASSAVIAFAERSTSSAWSLRISCAASSVTITGISSRHPALAARSSCSSPT